MLPSKVSSTNVFTAKGGSIFSGYRDFFFFEKLKKVFVRAESSSVKVFKYERFVENAKLITTIKLDQDTNIKCFIPWNDDSIFCSTKSGRLVLINGRSHDIEIDFLSEDVLRAERARGLEVRKIFRVNADSILLCMYKVRVEGIRAFIISLSSKSVVRELNLQNVDSDSVFLLSQSIPQTIIYNYDGTNGRGAALHNFDTNSELKKFLNPSNIVIYSISAYYNERTKEEYILMGGIGEKTHIHNVQTGLLVQSITTSFASWCSDMFVNRYYCYGTSRGNIAILDVQDDFKVIYKHETSEGDGIHGVKLYRGKNPDMMVLTYCTNVQLKIFQINGEGIFVPREESDEATKDLIERTEYLKSESEGYFGGSNICDFKIMLLGSDRSIVVFSKVIL